MFHPAFTSFFTPRPQSARRRPPRRRDVIQIPAPRASHAQALAYAARRRRAATEASERDNGVDGAYWKAGVPAALARAAALRSGTELRPPALTSPARRPVLSALRSWR